MSLQYIIFFREKMGSPILMEIFSIFLERNHTFLEFWIKQWQPFPMFGKITQIMIIIFGLMPVQL